MFRAGGRSGGEAGKGAKGEGEGEGERAPPDLGELFERMAAEDEESVTPEERARREASQADLDAAIEDAQTPGPAERVLLDLPLVLVRGTLVFVGVTLAVRCFAMLAVTHYPAMVYLEGSLLAPLGLMQTWQTAVLGDAALFAALLVTLPAAIAFWLRELYATQTALTCVPGMRERAAAKRHAALVLCAHALSLAGYTHAVGADFPAVGAALVAAAHLAYYALARCYIAASPRSARSSEREASVGSYPLDQRVTGIAVSAGGVLICLLAAATGVETRDHLRVCAVALGSALTLAFTVAARDFKLAKMGRLVGRDYSQAPPGVSTRPRPLKVSVPEWFDRWIIKPNSPKQGTREAKKGGGGGDEAGAGSAPPAAA